MLPIRWSWGARYRAPQETVPSASRVAGLYNCQKGPKPPWKLKVGSPNRNDGKVSGES